MTFLRAVFAGSAIPLHAPWAQNINTQQVPRVYNIEEAWITKVEKQIDVLDLEFVLLCIIFKKEEIKVLGLTEFAKWLADRLNLELVQYVDFSNSLHIYKSDYDQVERHFEILKKRESE